MIDKEKLKMLRISPNLLNDFGVLMAEEQKEHDNVHLDMLRHSTSHVMAQAVRIFFLKQKLRLGRLLRTAFTMILTMNPASRKKIFPRSKTG